MRDETCQRGNLNELLTPDIHICKESERPHLAALSRLYILERKEKRQCFHNFPNLGNINVP